MSIQDDNASVQRPWKSRSARLALVSVLSIAVIAGVLSFRSADQWRKRCLKEYAAASTASDTVRVDSMRFYLGKRYRYCRSYRQPVTPRSLK
jgi:hypothetical protein